MKKIKLGLSSYILAHKFIFKHKLYWYFVVPLLLNIILISITLFLTTEFQEYVLEISNSYVESKLGAYSKYLFVGSKVISLILVIIGYYYLYRTIILALLSPLLAYLSEKVEAIQTGKEYPFSLPLLLKDAWRGIKLALRNVFLEFTFVLLLLLLGFIPVFSIFVPVFIFLVQSYYVGFGMLDYSNERKRLTSSESKDYMQKNRSLVITNGSVFLLLFLIPLIGWIIAPIYGVVSASLAVIKNDDTILLNT